MTDIKRPARRSTNLSEKIITQIVELLDNWNKPKLTWELLVLALKDSAMPEYTRQALERQPRIKSAYLSMKGILRREDLAVRRPASLSKPTDDSRIRSLKAKIARLEQENTNLKERFLCWLNNAVDFGMTVEMLENPLPRIERGQTALDKSNAGTNPPLSLQTAARAKKSSGLNKVRKVNDIAGASTDKPSLKHIIVERAKN